MSDIVGTVSANQIHYNWKTYILKMSFDWRDPSREIDHELLCTQAANPAKLIPIKPIRQETEKGIVERYFLYSGSTFGLFLEATTLPPSSAIIDSPTLTLYFEHRVAEGSSFRRMATPLSLGHRPVTDGSLKFRIPNIPRNFDHSGFATHPIWNTVLCPRSLDPNSPHLYWYVRDDEEMEQLWKSTEIRRGRWEENTDQLKVKKYDDCTRAERNLYKVSGVLSLGGKEFKFDPEFVVVRRD